MNGEFLVRVDPLPEAVRTLAATLMRLSGDIDAEIHEGGSTPSGTI